MAGTDVGSLSPAERIGKAIKRSLPYLAPEARHEIQKFLTPQALGVMAAVIVAWVAAHFIGVGEAVDIVLGVVGVFAIGLVFDGIGHLWSFAEGAYNARSEAALDEAGKHFAEAVAILGIQATLAILFKNRPKSYKGGRAEIGPTPQQAAVAGVVQPGLCSTRSLGTGGGDSNIWGEIVICRLGTATDRRLAVLHESVRRLLTRGCWFSGGSGVGIARNPIHDRS